MYRNVVGLRRPLSHNEGGARTTLRDGFVSGRGTSACGRRFVVRTERERAAVWGRRRGGAALGEATPSPLRA